MRADRELIRRATEADIPQLNALFKEVFGADRTDSIWLWKFFRNPRGNFSYVAEADGRLVTHCGGTAVRFRAYEKPVVALQSVDFMSSPHYSGGIGGGGVFVRTVRAFFDDFCGPERIPVVYGFPGERHRMLGERLLGYRPVEQVTEFVVPPERSSAAVEPLQAKHLRWFDTEFAVGAIRDPGYLGWRYLEHPSHRYGIVVARRPWSMRPAAAAIVRETAECWYAMELFLRTADDAPRLNAVLAGLGKEVRFWANAGEATGRALHESGVRCASRDHYVEIRFFAGRAHPQRGELYYTLGDYDVY